MRFPGRFVNGLRLLFAMLETRRYIVAKVDLYREVGERQGPSEEKQDAILLHTESIREILLLSASFKKGNVVFPKAWNYFHYSKVFIVITEKIVVLKHVYCMV